LKTVLDVVRLDPTVARSRWSVVLERTVRELQGVECIDFEDHPAAKQQIACTRSFGTSITDLAPLQEAVSEFASRAAEKLRRQHCLASKLLVFVHTSPFRPGPQYSRSTVRPLRRPTADTALLVEAAVGGMAAIYKPGFKMSKAGVMLLELQPETVQQQELDFGEASSSRDRGRLMKSVDELNLRFGRKTMSMAATGLATERQDWSMRQERRTPQYTTSWDEMPVARA